MRGIVAASFALAVSGFAMQSAEADILFELGAANANTVRSADFGPGQGIAVAADTELTGFSFLANLPYGGDVKFMLWDADNATLLYSEVASYAPSVTQSWIGTGALDLRLLTGETYWFGIIADNTIQVGYLYPTVSYASDGLTALESGNSNYRSFDNPYFVGAASAQIALRIEGVSRAVPEIETWMMIGVGFAALALSRRKSRAARPV